MTKININEFTTKATNLMKFNDGDTDYLIWQGSRLMMQNRNGVIAFTDVTDIGNEAVILPAKAIELIKKVNSDVCDIGIDENIITVKYNKSKAKFNMAERVINAELPDISKSKTNTIPNELLNLIKKITRICTDKDFSRKSSDGLYFNGSGKQFEIVATDGYRVAVFTTDKCKGKMQLIIPKNTIDKIITLAAGKGADLELCEIEKKKAMFIIDDYTIITPTLAFEKYINYQAVKKQFDFNITVSANPYELKTALDRVAICRDKSTDPIIFSAKDNLIQIRANSTINKINEEVSTNCVEKPVERGFNPVLLQELLSFYNSDIDIMFCGKENSPLSITKEENGQSLFVLLLPMRYKKG